MRLFLIAASVASLLTSFSASAASTEEVREKASETADATGKWAKETKTEFQQDIQKHLSDLQFQIEDLKKQAAQETGHAQDQINQHLKKLESKRLKLAEQMKKAEQTSGRAWDQFKSGVSQAMTDLQNGFAQAKKEIQGSEAEKQNQ
jgi:TolA-binding protein